ncbi:MAG: heavy metal-responsive transcriptional regulator [Pseudomonadota bacterium]|nr:heavy metal-responsive transcriptional regulator [Nevskiales bacterium]MEC9364744.1 heavy metal-responsive transcriptional regulator [Pseudomonadota bacterium]
MSGMAIGDVARRTGLSVDTLRYYERIGLLQRVGRDSGGRRRYGDDELARLRFIQRAQRMNFRLDEIARLLEMRADPRRARDSVRRLTAEKLGEVNARLHDLAVLRNELSLLVNLCQTARGACPILDELGGEPKRRSRADPR